MGGRRGRIGSVLNLKKNGTSKNVRNHNIMAEPEQEYALSTTYAVESGVHIPLKYFFPSTISVENADNLKHLQFNEQSF